MTVLINEYLGVYILTNFFCLFSFWALLGRFFVFIYANRALEFLFIWLFFSLAVSSYLRASANVFDFLAFDFFCVPSFPDIIMHMRLHSNSMVSFPITSLPPSSDWAFGNYLLDSSTILATTSIDASACETSHAILHRDGSQ